VTWDRQLYFSSKGRRAEDFFAQKNPDGFSSKGRRAEDFFALKNPDGFGQV
jgi:hypothetical protein